MPSPALTPFDRSDPVPPVPGERERAAVRARARQLIRRRRTARVAGVAVAAAALAAATFSLVSLVSVTDSSRPDTDGAVEIVALVVRSTALEPGSTITVELRSDARTLRGTADDDGTVRFDGDVAPGTYEVFVTTEGPPSSPAPGGVQLGRGVTTYRGITITLEPGVNTLHLDRLTPATP